jgi:hypothetical protein
MFAVPPRWLRLDTLMRQARIRARESTTSFFWEICMFKKLKLLRGGISTVADLEASLAEFDIAALESAYVTAQQRRTDLLITAIMKKSSQPRMMPQRRASISIVPTPPLPS